MKKPLNHKIAIVAALGFAAVLLAAAWLAGGPGLRDRLAAHRERLDQVQRAAKAMSEPRPRKLDLSAIAESDPAAAKAHPLPNKPLELIADELGLEFPPPAVSITVRKSSRRLELHSGSILLKTYPVALGADADGRPTAESGPKSARHDRLTPEGWHYICTREPDPERHLFLGISYPNIEDAQRGLERGLIDRRVFEIIKGEIRSGTRPSWGTALGGGIGIHGGGRSRDWTDGGIALEDPEIEELWAVVEPGTSVRILP